MNTLDMYSREKVNKIHLDEMHREAQSRGLSSLINQAADSENVTARQGNPALFIKRLARWFWSRPSNHQSLITGD